jgi:hypothetical protein
MAKPSFWHDDLELRRDGQTVGKSSQYGGDGEAQGRTWQAKLTTFDGNPVGQDDPRGRLRGLAKDVLKATAGMSQVEEYGLVWKASSESFGSLKLDDVNAQATVRVGDRSLYWHWHNPWLGGAGWSYIDRDFDDVVVARRQPFRTVTWQDIAVDDQVLQEPEAIVAAQLGCRIWEHSDIAHMHYTYIPAN